MKLNQQAGKEVYRTIPVPSSTFAHLTQIITTALEYLTDAITLEQAEKMLGIGKDHMPKNPKTPITWRIYKTQPNYVSANFYRKDEKSKWSKINTGLYADLNTYYALNLEPKYFSALVLVKAETFIDGEFEENQRAKNRFTFKLKEGRPTDIRVVFTADTIYSDVKDGYPKNFEDVSIIRLDANGNDPTAIPPKTLKAPAVAALTARFGQPCPKSGWWKASTLDATNWNIEAINSMKPRRVEQGKPMPDLGTPSDTPDKRAAGNASILWTWVQD